MDLIYHDEVASIHKKTRGMVGNILNQKQQDLQGEVSAGKKVSQVEIVFFVKNSECDW